MVVCTVQTIKCHVSTQTRSLTPYSCALHITPSQKHKINEFRFEFDMISRLIWNIFVWHGLCGVLAMLVFHPSHLVSSPFPPPFPSLFVITFRYFKYVRLFVWYLRRIYLFTFNPTFSLLKQILIRHIIRYNDQWNSE